jgi:Thermostable hemolysin
VIITRAFEVYETGNPGRVELESFVQDAFARRHGARVRTFMPTLAALRDASGQLCSVAGLRSAHEESLYLEAYLAQPVDAALSERTHEKIGRAEVVEVGNLASGGCRAARQLVALLPQLLLDRGHRWVVFTATASVRRILQSLDAPLLELAPATADRVATRADDWGRYYASDPRVMAGYLPDGVRLANALGALLGRRPRA